MRYRILILLLALLATVQPSPAPVTVPPEATPPPHARQRKAETETPAGASRLVGTWQGVLNDFGTNQYRTGNYQYTTSTLLTVTIGASGHSVTTTWGPISVRLTSAPPPGFNAASVIRGGTDGPTRAHPKNASVEWVYNATTRVPVHARLILNPDGRTASYIETPSGIDNGGIVVSASGRATLARLR